MTEITSKYTSTADALIVADKDASGKFVVIDTFPLADLPEEFREMFVAEGLSKKLQADTSEVKVGSITKGDVTAEEARDNFVTKVAAMREVYTRLCAGEWSAPREATTRIPPTLPAAVAQVFGYPIEKATELVFSAQSATIATLKSRPDIVKAMADIAASRSDDSEPNELDGLVEVS